MYWMPADARFGLLIGSCLLLIGLGCDTTSTTAATGGAAVPGISDVQMSSLSEREQNLVSSFQKSIGFQCLVADKLYAMHPGYAISIHEFFDLDIINPKTGKSMSVDFSDREGKFGKKGPAEVATEIWNRMGIELGEQPPVPPNAPPLLEPQSLGHDMVQEILYPEKYKELVFIETEKDLAESARIYTAGQREEGLSLLTQIISRRAREFGRDDPRTLKVIKIYHDTTQKYIHIERTENGQTTWDLTADEVKAKGLVPNPDGTVSLAPSKPLE